MQRLKVVSVLLLLFLASTGFAEAVIEEILVTAQKREQNLQDVSISVSAFSGEQLRALGVEEPEEMTQYIPNLQFQHLGAVDSIRIRGIGVNEIQDPSEAQVAFYVDEVYKSTNAGQAIQFFDLERVEVLRGPQGTLFGRNATGGLVHVITRKPADEFDFQVSGQYGNFNQKIVELAVGGPLSDGARARVAFKYNNDDGWQTNRQDGSDWAVTDAWAVRGQLEFDLGEDATLLLKAAHTEMDNLPYLPVLYDIFPDLFGPGTGPAGFSNPEGLKGLDNNDLTYSDFPPDSPDDTDITDFSATLNWSLRDTVTLTSITAHTTTDRFYVEEAAGPTSGTLFDLFLGLNEGIPTFRGLEAKQFSQELRLAGIGERTNWTFGAFYFDDDKDDGLSHTTPFIFETLNIYEQQTESWALFGQTEYAITDQLRAVAGLRYTEDDLELDLTGFAITSGSIDAQQALKTDNVSWKVGLDYQPMDDVLLYASVSTGFKSGGFNTTAVTIKENTEPVGEEEVLNAELGWKATLGDGRVRFNGAFFYSDYTELQGLGYTLLPTGLIAAQLVNYGDAEIYGGEFEVTLVPTEALELLVSLGWLESELETDDPASPSNGEGLAHTPQFTLGVIGNYTINLDAGGSLVAQLAANWTDEHYFGETDDLGPGSMQDDYWLLDARLTWILPNDRVSISAFGKNLADEHYRTHGFDVAGFGQGIVPAPGRTYGVRISYSY